MPKRAYVLASRTKIDIFQYKFIHATVSKTKRRHSLARVERYILRKYFFNIYKSEGVLYEINPTCHINLYFLISNNN